MAGSLLRKTTRKAVEFPFSEMFQNSNGQSSEPRTRPFCNLEADLDLSGVLEEMTSNHTEKRKKKFMCVN